MALMKMPASAGGGLSGNFTKIAGGFALSKSHTSNTVSLTGYSNVYLIATRYQCYLNDFFDSTDGTLTLLFKESDGKSGTGSNAESSIDLYKLDNATYVTFKTFSWGTSLCGVMLVNLD